MEDSYFKEREEMESYVRATEEMLRKDRESCEELQRGIIDVQLETKSYVAVDAEETEICAICQSELEDGDALADIECRHQFHRDCIKTWLAINNTCPLCKSAGVPFGCCSNVLYP